MQQGIDDKISLPIELRIAADDQLIEMAVAVFKRHRASTAAIQHNLMGTAGDEILTVAAVAVKLRKIALDGQRTSRKIIAVVSGIIGIGGLHDEVAGYIDSVHLFGHFQIATRVVIYSIIIVICSCCLNAVIPLYIQRTFVTKHRAAGLDDILIDGQCTAVQINGAAGYIHSAMGQQGVSVEIQRAASGYDDITVGFNIGIQHIIIRDNNICVELGLLVHLVQIRLALHGADGGSDGLQAGVRHYGGGKDAQDVIIVRHGFLLVMLQIVADRVFQVVHTGDDPLIVRVGYTGPDTVQAAVTVVYFDEFFIAVGAFQE